MEDWCLKVGAVYSAVCHICAYSIHTRSDSKLFFFLFPRMTIVRYGVEGNVWRAMPVSFPNNNMHICLVRIMVGEGKDNISFIAGL